MRISVFGQRSINDSATVTTKFDLVLAEYEKDHPITFVHGGAKGPQSILHDYLKDECDVVLFKPWTMISKKLSKQAMEGGSFDPVYFFFRNIQIVENSDLVIIFDNGEQDGEVYKVKNLCDKKGIKYVEVPV